MKVRITQAMKGTLDGIDLTKFEVGRVYDMGSALGNYMMASGYGTPVADEKPAPGVPPDHADDRDTHTRKP